MLRLIPLREAWRLIKDRLPRIKLEVITLSASKAQGFIAAEDVLAKTTIPEKDIALFDGFAVRAEDVFSASHSNPVILRISRSPHVAPGEAFPIMTGMPLPEGANAVVPLEYVRCRGNLLEVYRKVPPFAYVARRGEDVEEGTRIVAKGTLIGALEVAMMLRGGVNRVHVFRPLRIGMVVIGSELTRDPNQVSKGKVMDVTSIVVRAVLGKYAKFQDYGIVPDELKLILRAISSAAEENDIVITIGGTSIGERDLTVKAVEQLGDILFHGVSIMPGRPMAAGVIGKTPVFTLSGFPVAAFSEVKFIVEPYVLKLIYGSSPRFYPMFAIAGRRIPSRIGVLEMVRVELKLTNNKLVAYPIRARGSGILSSIVMADGVVIVEEDFEGYDEGDLIPVFRLEDPWGLRYV